MIWVRYPNPGWTKLKLGSMMCNVATPNNKGTLKKQLPENCNAQTSQNSKVVSQTAPQRDHHPSPTTWDAHPSRSLDTVILFKVRIMAPSPCFRGSGPKSFQSLHQRPHTLVSEQSDIAFEQQWTFWQKHRDNNCKQKKPINLHIDLSFGEMCFSVWRIYWSVLGWLGSSQAMIECGLSSTGRDWTKVSPVLPTQKKKQSNKTAKRTFPNPPF